MALPEGDGRADVRASMVSTRAARQAGTGCVAPRSLQWMTLITAPFGGVVALMFPDSVTRSHTAHTGRAYRQP